MCESKEKVDVGTQTSDHELDDTQDNSSTHDYNGSSSDHENESDQNVIAHEGVEEYSSGEEAEEYVIVDQSLACNYPSQPYVGMRGAFTPPGWKKVYKRKRANDTSSSGKKRKLFH